MAGWRKIVVDGVEYTWKFGTGVTCIRLEGRSFAKYDTAQLLGLTPDQHERAIWKRTVLQTVRPSLIAETIRATLSKTTPVLPKEKRRLMSEMNWSTVMRVK